MLGKDGESAAAIALDSLNLKNVSFMKVGLGIQRDKGHTARAVLWR
jgi:hypothetical protein